MDIQADTDASVTARRALARVEQLFNSTESYQNITSSDDLQQLLYQTASDNPFGGRVTLPRGVFKLSSPIVVPSKVVLSGVSKRSTRLVASGSFPFDEPMITIGRTAPSFDSRIENLTVDAANRVNTCIYSSSSNEGSGARDILATGFTDIGIFFTGTGCQHSELIDVELYGSSSGWNGGVKLFNTGATTYASRITINGLGNIDGLFGFLCDGRGDSSVSIENLHLENVEDGILLKESSGASVRMISGNSSVKNLVTIDPLFRGSFVGMFLAGAKTIINDPAGSISSGQASQVAIASIGRILSR